MAEFRRDPITGRWVVIAAERAQRPSQFAAANNMNKAEPCPFCAGNEALTPPEVLSSRLNEANANQPGWRVRVVPNKYPALLSSGHSEPSDDAFYQTQPGLGVHEADPSADQSPPRVGRSPLGIHRLRPAAELSTGPVAGRAAASAPGIA